MWKNIEYKNWRILFKSDESKMTPFNHNHLDYYSFILIYKDKIILTDSGGSSYDSKLKDTDARLPEYHNSIKIMNLGYKPANSRYFTKNYIDCKFKTTVNKNANHIEIKLMSTGFNRIDNKINLTRLIKIFDSMIIVEDRSFSNKIYPIEHYFHFPMESTIKQSNNNLHMESEGNLLNISYDENSRHIEINKNKFLRYYSEQYNQPGLKNYIKIFSSISLSKPIIHKFEIQKNG
tara:strand:+ start:2332 stop:3033 length:702 start_codon:yes stop_codon:yes gene_type:complete